MLPCDQVSGAAAAQSLFAAAALIAADGPSIGARESSRKKKRPKSESSRLIL
jgi:hypothetical protein